MDKRVEERLDKFLGPAIHEESHSLLLPQKFHLVQGPFPVVSREDDWAPEFNEVMEALNEISDHLLTERFLAIVEKDLSSQDSYSEQADQEWWESNYWRQVNEGYFGDPPRDPDSPWATE